MDWCICSHSFSSKYMEADTHRILTVLHLLQEYNDTLLMTYLAMFTSCSRWTDISCYLVMRLLWLRLVVCTLFLFVWWKLPTIAVQWMSLWTSSILLMTGRLGEEVARHLFSHFNWRGAVNKIHSFWIGGLPQEKLDKYFGVLHSWGI